MDRLYSLQSCLLYCVLKGVKRYDIVSFKVILILFIGLDIIEEICEVRGLNILLKKLYREFMIMGFISFALYIISDQYSVNDHTWYTLYL